MSPVHPRHFFFALAAVAVAFPLQAWAGEVLVVRSSDRGPYVEVEQAFASSLGTKPKTLSLSSPSAAADLKAAFEAGPDLVLAIGWEAAKATNEAGVKCPVVVALVPDAQRAALGSRVVVVPMFPPASRQLEAVKALLPTARRFGVLFDPKQSQRVVAEHRTAMEAADLTLVAAEVSSRQQVAAAGRDLLEKVDALWLVPDTTVVAPDTFKYLIQNAVAAKVPVVGFSEGMAKAGALVAIEAEYAEMGRNAAAAARRLAAGEAATGEAPRGKVYLNGRMAELLGLSIPVSVRASAAKVYE